YYVLSVKPQMKGDVAPNVDEMEGVANRLFVYGLHFNDVPEDVTSFLDWSGTVTAPEFWQQAAAVYEALLPSTPSYRSVISLARTYGFLGMWKEAAVAYAKLFEREAFVVPGAKKIDPEAIRARPELLPAYIEWGVAEQRAARADRDKARRERALGIFVTV